MERGTLFHPPPFLGTGINQNHQIRALKNNSLPFLPTYRSLQPSLSHASPSLALLTSRGTAVSNSNFSRTSLTSLRRRHLRKCWDLLQLSIHRRELKVAAKFLKVILAAHEWSTNEGWQTALLLLALNDSSSTTRGEGEGERRGKLEWLQQVDRESSSHFKATQTTYALVSEYVAVNQLSSAIELLELRVNMHPYRGQPELHVTLGMLYVFVGVQTLLNNLEGEEAEERRGGGVELRKLDRATKVKARRCFEQAIQASAAWVRGETARRQRVYGMGRKERVEDGRRLGLGGKRGDVWGRDLVGGGEEGETDAWPRKEHPDIGRVRRRIEGGVEEGADYEGEGGTQSSATPSDAMSNSDDSDDDDEGEERRGRSRTRSQRDETINNDDDGEADPDATLPNEAEESKKGTKAWSSVWPEVASIFSPSQPFAYHLAQQFLELLSPSHLSQQQSASQGVEVKRRSRPDARAEEDEEEEGTETGGEEMVGGVQLTREEAERRLRSILFEGEESTPAPRRGDGEGGRRRKIKKEKGRENHREREERREKRKHRHEHHDHHRSEKSSKRREEKRRRHH